MNRREVLVGMGAVVLSTYSGDAADSDAANDARLRSDIDRLLPRENSEEGVPVLLACVNLVGKAHAAPSPFSAAVAAEFRRDAPSWERIQPKSSDTDIGKLIEVLAARDVARGGKVGA